MDELTLKIDELNSSIQRLINLLSGLDVLDRLSYPPNAPGIMTQVIIPVAVGVAERLPDISIPPRMQLVIKANPNNTLLIYVGKTKSEAEQPGVAYPLIQNEAVTYKIANANQVWFANQVAGEGINITVEQGG